MLWPTVRIAVNGCTAALFEQQKALQSALRYAETFDLLNRPVTALIAEEGGAECEEDTKKPQEKKALFPDLEFDIVLFYHPAASVRDFTGFFSRVAQEHTAKARVWLAFQLPQYGLRLSVLLPPGAAADMFTAAEFAFFSDRQNERFAWNESTVACLAEEAGYTVRICEKKEYQESRLITQAELSRWFSAESAYGTAIREHFSLQQTEFEKIMELLKQRCRKPVSYLRTVVYMSICKKR